MKLKHILFLILILSISCTNKEEKSRLLVNEGIKLTYDGKYAEAMKKFDEAIEVKPDFAEAFVWRCRSYIELKDYETALEDIDKALELNPNYGEAYKTRAQLKGMIGDQDGACKDYLKAEELGIPNLGNYTRKCR